MLIMFHLKGGKRKKKERILIKSSFLTIEYTSRVPYLVKVIPELLLLYRRDRKSVV